MRGVQPAQRWLRLQLSPSIGVYRPCYAFTPALLTPPYHSHGDFYEIMDMLDKRLNDKGKNWRHVLKSLKVLDYCLHEGSEMVVTWARKNIYIIKTLREFQYIEEDGRDVGQNG